MKDIMEQIQELAVLLLRRNFFLSTAESCTGGLIGHLLTNEPGSSSWYIGGVVAYADSMKINILGVERDLIDRHGAVSSQCVSRMSRGVSSLTGSQVSMAVSGIAGPGGGTMEKPVGTVYISWSVLGDIWWEKNIFSGTRQEIKTFTARKAINGLLDYLNITER
jgi:nicotinamide-nucleotide amidase